MQRPAPAEIARGEPHAEPHRERAEEQGAAGEIPDQRAVQGGAFLRGQAAARGEAREQQHGQSAEPEPARPDVRGIEQVPPGAGLRRGRVTGHAGGQTESAARRRRDHPPEPRAPARRRERRGGEERHERLPDPAVTPGGAERGAKELRRGRLVGAKQGPGLEVESEAGQHEKRDSGPRSDPRRPPGQVVGELGMSCVEPGADPDQEGRVAPRAENQKRREVPAPPRGRVGRVERGVGLAHGAMVNPNRPRMA